MKIGVVICTINRPDVLHQTVLSVLRQALLPVQIVISSPGTEHVRKETLDLPGVDSIFSPSGSAIQRNASLVRIRPDVDLVAFLDDDIQLSRFYFAEMARLFLDQPELLIASGRLLHDGGRGSRIETERARQMCEEFDRSHDPHAPIGWRITDSGYGCNMCVRYEALGGCRFDENLPLYAWLEDRDFSFRLTKGKFPPVEFYNAAGVHLGSRSGRVSGVRLGFSTVVNPIYLRRKSQTFTMQYIVVHYWLRCFIGNLIGVITGDKEYDRWGLLKGNLLGYWHLLHGRCNPGYILQL
jgi:glycosyltransferase involved in cell wall biosynthesis